MARPLRYDRSGKRWHVTNRGVGKRPIFVTRTDVRRFMLLVVLAARAGHIQILSYSILTTHYHLFLVSVDGEISQTMQWIESQYATYFNATRDRDGPVFKGRFKGKWVTTRRYVIALVRYIDWNAVDAKTVDHAEQFSRGSAQAYVRGRGSPWLARDALAVLIRGEDASGGLPPEAYLQLFAHGATPGLVEVMDRIAASRTATLPDTLDDLVGAAAPHVQRWLAANAKNADGGPSGVIVAAACTVRSILRDRRLLDPDRSVVLSRVRRIIWDLMEPGLLHGGCGLTFDTIARQLELTAGTSRNRTLAHRQAVLESEGYAVEAAAVLGEAIERDFGRPAAARETRRRRDLEK